MTATTWSQPDAARWLDQQCRRRDPHARLVCRQPRRWYSTKRSRRRAPENLSDRARESLADAIDIAAEANGAVQVAPSFAFYPGLARGVDHFSAVCLAWSKPAPQLIDPSPAASYICGRPFSLRQLALVAELHELELPPQLQPVDVIGGPRAGRTYSNASILNPERNITASAHLIVDGVFIPDDESYLESFQQEEQ